MAGSIINVGNKIELSVIYAGRSYDKSDEQLTYVSQILDMEDDGTIIAALPIYEGRLITLEVGYKLNCYFYTANGIYNGRTLIEARYKENNLYFMKLTLEGELKKFQRRQYFRLPCNIEATMRPLSIQEVLDYSESNELKEEPDLEPERGVIVDISGGGVRVFSGNHYDKNDYVYITFDLDMNIGVRQLGLLARVVMSIESPNREDYYDNRLQFKEIPAKTRDVIVKYIFEQQRKNQGRGRE